MHFHFASGDFKIRFNAVDIARLKRGVIAIASNQLAQLESPVGRDVGQEGNCMRKKMSWQ